MQNFYVCFMTFLEVDAVTSSCSMPQEANAKEVKIEKRPALLLELQQAAPDVLKHLTLAGERTESIVTNFHPIFI